MIPFFDTHTHILPSVDDGAKSKTEAENMIKSIRSQGVHNVCLTSHFYPYQEPLEDFILRRNTSFNTVKELFYQNNITPYLGSEIYLSGHLFTNSKMCDLCIGNTRLALIELPFRPLEKNTFVLLDKLQNQYNVRPVLAHINRYDFFKNNKQLKQLRSIGCMFQMNLEVFEDSFLKRHNGIKLLRKGQIDFLGSDCHNMTNRKPVIKDTISYLYSKNLKEDLEKIFNNTKKYIK